jgi:N,N'-diacetyl-8-epilegionaminate cytidylyltransferase
LKASVLGAIFARGGSKGVPRKNVREIAGKPLIGHAIEACRAARTVDRVVVSTDDEEIAAVARRFGAEVPFIRPPELARDDAPEWLAWQHMLQTLQETEGALPEVFLPVPTTSPLRAVEDLDACVNALCESDVDLVITVRRAERSPYYNMVTLDDAGRARLVIPPSETIHGRQAAPAVYDMTTVAYAARPEYVLRARSLFEGSVRAVVVPAERSIDIDNELDWEIAEFLLNRRLKLGSAAA